MFWVSGRKTPLAFRNSCDDFISTEVLRDLNIEHNEAKINHREPDSSDTKKTRQQLCCDTRPFKIIRNSAGEYSDDEDWTPLGNCGGLIHPDFDSRAYCYATLTKLIEATGLFEIDYRQ
jgi:hypothetical protein